MTVHQYGVYANQSLIADASDEELVTAACLGCGDSLTVLLTRYLPFITRKAVTADHSFLDQDDLIQEGMIALLRAIRCYQNGRNASFVTYAVTCINNSIRSTLRTSARLKHLPLLHYVTLDEEHITMQTDQQYCAAATSSPETLVIKKEEYAFIWQAIRSLLSELEREILMLYLNGLTYDQMAARLGITGKSVDNALQRARKKLGAAMR